MYARRDPPEEPPCETCRVVQMEGNKTALAIFFEVNDQYIMGMNGPITLKHEAIDLAMKRHRVPRRKYNDCFYKVVNLGRWWIERIRNQ